MKRNGDSVKAANAKRSFPMIPTRRKLYLLLALLLCSGVASAQVVIKGNVYGGGEGTTDNKEHGLVTGNTSVTMNGGNVWLSIYGGGEFGSVGTFTSTTPVVYNAGQENQLTVDVPTACQPNTGLASVVLNGGKVGLGKKAVMPTPGTSTWDDAYGYVFAGGRGEADSINYPKSIACAVVGSTYLEINNGMLITASAYGGCENGLLLGNAHVKMKGGQIGVPYWETTEGGVQVQHWDTTSFYQSNYETLWTNAINAIRTGTEAQIIASAASFHRCDAWPYGNNSGQYLVYDIFANQYDSQGGAFYATDGNTFFGKLYGGGSGYYPFWDEEHQTAVWRKSAGRVMGNTQVEITGGHILTSVFGGNELTDVVGSSTVLMTGGTVGIPEIKAEIEGHPLHNHVFGSGFGDQRTAFNKWTNVGSSVVSITGGAVFGSVFGGGEEGHVLGNATVTIKDEGTSSPLIGTWGSTTFDGNVFGGGRGFVGAAYTAGGVGGNTEVNIEGGTMLGSVYGGGRLATIGAYFVESTNTNYGQLQPDNGTETHGYTVVNIKGGTIGNRFELTTDEFGFTKGGNVFGGSKGRLTLLNGSANANWDKTSKVKETEVHINKAADKDLVIKGHVYGGGEVGQVMQNTLVDIDNGTIGTIVTVGTGTAAHEYRLGGNVYGGGKGTPSEVNAGWVKGNAYVDMSNGHVQRSIYGGGEFGSVGDFTEYYTVAENGHVVGEPKVWTESTGLASVTVSGGTVGLSEAMMPTPGTDAVDDDFGYIFAGGRGTNDPESYLNANLLAVVADTYLEISNASNQTLINASVYGGCENGLVMNDTKVWIKGGQIGNGYKVSDNTWDGVYPESQWYTVITAITAENPDATTINTLVEGFNECDAWPFGNSNNEYLPYDVFGDFQGGSLNASDGNSFFGNVFGGGSGYYPYKKGYWRRTAGRVYGNTEVEITGGHILTAVFGAGEISDVMGTSTVKMSGGTVGVPQTEAEITGHPLNSHVFGGGKGDPRPYFNEWTNAQTTNVEITGGVVFGSVFGGGEDGHVLGNTNVTVKNIMDEGTVVSSPFIGTWGKTAFDGNLFAGGRGFSGNTPTVGGVVGNTTLTMEGGRVLGSVYGGGRLAAVGVNLATGALYDDDAKGKATVTVSGGTVGNAYETDANSGGHMIGGNVYGGSRGSLINLNGSSNDNWAAMGKVRNTDVNIEQKNSSIPTLIKGNVYGGGEIAQVTKNTDVAMTGGTIGTIAYDYTTSSDHSKYDTILHVTGGNVYGAGHGDRSQRDAAWVMNNSTVAIGGGQVWYNVYGGGEMASVGQRTITYGSGNTITAIEPVANTGLATVTITGGQVGPGPKEGTEYNIPVGLNSFDGYVFGGGQGIGNDPITSTNPYGQYYNFADVNNTLVTVEIPASADINTNRIWGSVFGGSEDGHVLDSTTVYYKSGLTGTYGTTSYDGNIFGGGRNYQGKNYTAGRVQGNTHIEMEGGQVYGCIYGGGRLSLTGCSFKGLAQGTDGKYSPMLDGNNHGRTMVLVKGGTVGNNTETGVTNPDGSKELFIETFSDHSMGNVYGGGMGNVKGLTAAGHPLASALLIGMVKKTVVEVSEVDPTNHPTRIYGIVFGGGEIANVGKYTWDQAMTSTGFNISNIEISEGLAKVKIKGGTIGANRAKMRCDLASDNPNDDNFWLKYNDDLGYVYGGGEGIVDDPEAKDANGNDVYPTVNIKLDGVNYDHRIIDLMATVNNTEVEFSGGWAKASVFGGGEAGHVMHDTKVTISGGQIGAGDNGTTDLLYDDSETVFFNPATTRVTDQNSLHGTDHWDYGNTYNGAIHYDPFDLVLLKQGITPSDGKSWFGNVFGGGSGWFPYVKKNTSNEYQCYWNPYSGRVWGNTEVIITGGHILNNVYGANETTNVGGKAKVTMSGGTVGVPRTKDQILAQPTICYVFGGGGGDERTIFDDNTNVTSTEVKIEGGFIYGSVFGGAEDGHVLANAEVTIDQASGKTTVIGSRGNSSADGNVFGGGRNFLELNKAAGRVGGSTTVYIKGGTMLGSVFGGGRYAQTGVGTNGEYVYDATNPNKGKATVNISGGTIGNAERDYAALLYDSDQSVGDVFGSGKGDKKTYEKLWSGCVANSEITITGNPRIYGNVWGGGELASVGYLKTTGEYETNNGKSEVTVRGGTIGTEYEFTQDHMNHNPAPVWTSYEEHNGVKRVRHTCSGNVMGGSRGEADVTKPHWVSLARSRTATVTINAGANIMGNVFGGPEQGTMAEDSKVIINGGTIGQENLLANDGSKYSFGSVFGGGYGSENLEPHTNDSSNVLAGNISGRVYGNSTVELNGGQVYGNVYGGGEMASVGHYTYTYNSNGEVTNVACKSGGTATVTMSGGKVGPLDGTGLNAYVFGGPKGGQIAGMRPYCNVNTASVTVNMPINDDNCVYGSLFGGGSDGHVLGDASVTIKNGYIGTTGTTTWDGNIFGGGRNFFAISYSAGRVGGNTTVNVDGGTMLGSIFGGGRLGNVGVDINGDMIDGTDHGYTTVNVGVRTRQENYITIGHPSQSTEDRIGGNVYGGGKGLPGPSTSMYPGLAKVKQTEVNIDQKSGKQTFVEGSVFGGGEDGHVLIDTYVNVKDGQIGGTEYNLANPTLCTDLYHGNVYGGGRGLDTYTGTDNQQHYSPTAGKVEGNTHVMITGGRVCRSVFGGGNLASVGNANELPDASGNYHTGWAYVTLTENAHVGVSPNSGNRNGMVFGAGKGKAGEAYKELSMVKNTKVIITGNSKVTTTVYGSGEDGHTRHRTDILIGDATVNGSTVDGQNVVIGINGVPGLEGNVYGGGRGADIDPLTNTYSSTAGIVGISTNIEINDGTVKGSVFGGGRMASVGYEAVLDVLDNGSIDLNKLPTDYGKATVHITGNATIGAANSTYDNGHVFGSGRGDIGDEFKNLASVHWTDVTVNGNAQVYGSVFGGGLDGHVKKYTPTGHTGVTKYGDTHVTIGALNPGNDVCNIATETTTDQYKGNVYGGGRGFGVDVQQNFSPTAGRVEGNTKVDILSGNVWRNVFGGGSQAVVSGRKLVNIFNGYVNEDVHGGSNAIPVPTNNPSQAALWAHSGLKTVNVRGGHIHGSVYGCSHSSNDGYNESGHETEWTSFVNINGGQIDEAVHGAGYAGLVNGSVCVNIGANAILSAPNKDFNIDYNKAHTGLWTDTDPAVEPTASTLVIGGSVYGGSDYYGTTTTSDWDDYDVSGYSLIFIDGTGYNTTDGATATNYMNIGGGLFGSGTHTESGELGRHILLKEYGTRTPSGNGEMASATRTLTTIQRAGNVIIDHANVNLSGAYDISDADLPTLGNNPRRKYGVMKVDESLLVTNASGIVLGTPDTPASGENPAVPGNPVFMDSIRQVRSVYLKSGVTNSYVATSNDWEWIGIQNDDNHLYRIPASGTPSQYLEAAEENVVIFNDTSKLWVRYHDKKTGDATWKQYYGELQGFFRMRGEEYDPHQKDKGSFAYARPKITQEAAEDDNKADGGWLSYNSGFNYFTDEGVDFTKTQQYPYINVLDYSKGDRVEYREWLDPRQGTRWYVDGTRGWGQDKLKSEDIQVGRYPNKPKKTLFGKRGDDNCGVVNEQSLLDSYSYETDIVYVVGAISADDEKEIVRCAQNSDNAYIHKYPLKLYRYPGGHTMSNNQIDYGTGEYSPEVAPLTWVPVSGNAGPGMNKGAMVDVQPGKTLTMKGVVIDGLYNYTHEDAEFHEINTALPEASRFDATKVTEPLIITHNQSTLSLGDSTVLMRGYNGTNADVWYTDAFYDTAYLNLHNNDDEFIHETGFRHGGAIYVDAGATVNVSDTVYITGNKQYLKIGENGADQYVESNVFLPTFQKSLNITGALDESTNIGVTSPRGNADPTYLTNTLSPVATAANATIASAAWTNNNFTDDQQWFFGNSNKSTYHTNVADASYMQPQDVYFGWTWANVVRKAPVADADVEGSNDFSYTNIDHPEDLAWLISQSVGMNGETAIDFDDVTIKQTNDIDLGQYVWVPIGDSLQDSHRKQFAGTFDGQGHLISNLSIQFIGTGDTRYNRQNYGMFGYVKGGTVKRTFVVSGTVNPEIAAAGAYNIGGLVGCLEGEVSSSEAALNITSPNFASADMTIGGLVGKLESGEIHSSMAMPLITTLGEFNGAVGGLVGNANGSETAPGAIYNSFVNGEFSLTDEPKAGGLLGVNNGATMKNCYVNWDDTQFTVGNSFKSIVNVNSGTINDCYDMFDSDIAAGTDNSKEFSPVASADLLGYMYKDNVIQMNANTDMALFKRLNEWADANNTGGSHKYARWARPGLGEVNGDLPVLLLYEDINANDEIVSHQGSFRSVSTYAGTTALQYGGPVRDGEGNELDAALTRPLKKNDEGSDIPEYLFVYGDINSVSTGLSINRSKVSIHEDVAIKDAGSLADFANTYVGVTFDNSFGHATSTPGINFMGEQLLPRDWHMFSSPLSNAPQGFNYQGGNNSSGPTNNPWVTPNNEFSWLQSEGTNNNARYWMYGWDNSLSQITAQFNVNNDWVDGYFPSQSTTFGEGWISGSDEEGRYPYGMDFYTWYEPDYHWINFKRNGPNHWHSDETSPREHAQINYVNEDKLIVGRGYMGAIANETFMQSHGNLNTGEKSIALTKQGNYLTGWNLVGNPYHGYLDFNKVGRHTGNSNVLSHDVNGTSVDAFYVIYDADQYENHDASTAFRYYPVGASKGGDYASQYLHPHQGFYVLAETGDDLTFTEDMLVDRKTVGGTGGFRDEPQPAYPLVNLYLNSDNGCADVTVIEFERPEWGGARKLKELRVGDGLFYAHHDNAYYAALFAQEGVDRVPLWFEAKEDDIFTMKWNLANADFHSMYLIDNIAGVQYDMLKNDSYMFEGHTEDYPSRFLIVFDLTGLEEQEDEGEHPFAFFNGSEWVVTGDGDLQFIDMLGQVLAQKHISGQTHIYLPRVADGPYLFRLINGKETKIQKVIITK